MLVASSIELEADEWLLHLASWVIQDGNLRDVAVGAELERALLFHTDDLSAAAKRPAAIQRRAADYDVVGDLRREWRIWILSFGMLAYAEGPGWDVPSGSVSGTVRLELDPYPFEDSYRHLPGMPQLTHRWTLTGLWRLDDHGRTTYGEDLQLHAISETNAWDDDGGHAMYLLRCRLQREV